MVSPSGREEEAAVFVTFFLVLKPEQLIRLQRDLSDRFGSANGEDISAIVTEAPRMLFESMKPCELNELAHKLVGRDLGNAISLMGEWLVQKYLKEVSPDKFGEDRSPFDKSVGSLTETDKAVASSEIDLAGRYWEARVQLEEGFDHPDLEEAGSILLLLEEYKYCFR